MALKSITFTVPKTTPAGTYRIYGGYLDVTHRSGGYEWLDKYAKFYRMEISDLTITVLKGDIETVEDLIDAIGADVTLNSEAAINAAKRGQSVILVEKGATKRSGAGGSGCDHWESAATNPCSGVSPEDLVQAMLEKADCPYQGSGPSGSFLALNKAAAKQIFRMAGLPTADWEFLPVRPAEGWEPRLPWPLFVKTTTGGSSLRLGRAINRQELDALMDEIFAAGEGVLIEPQLPGKEITCGILGEEAMPPILIEPVAGDYFDYESKYASGGARELCPAPVSPAVTAEVQRLALAAHKALGLKGYSRADFILGPDDSLHLLEVNTLPGMTPTSLVPQEAAQLGMDFGQLLEKLIELGMEQHAKA